MEDTLKQKDDELNGVLDSERSRAAAISTKEKEFSDLRISLESKLASAQNLNDNLQLELDRMRAEQANTERGLRTELEELRASRGNRGLNNDSEELERENQELRSDLEEQQRVTDEVRREAQEFLREMRMLSERSDSSYEKEEELTNTINKLEAEVRDWRNRYARTKTQLRSLRASSIGLTIQPNVAKYTQDSEFTEANGLVKDVHVTKFQISIDELLRVARTEEPAKVIDFMKIAVVNVRNITQDIDTAQPASDEMTQLQVKLKARVSATANNLITASKNFASANGLSPVSILDAAVSHLTAAVVELVRTVKIRPTPAGELEDDDDGNLEPVDSTGFFPVRDPTLRQENNPPPFQGLRNVRTSAESSMYSPLNSPRESAMSRPKSTKATSVVTPRANSFMNGNRMPPPAPMGTGFGIRTQDTDVEDLKVLYHT
jgi:myosin heavy subunit